MTGLDNDDIYVFDNSYGTDTFADYYGKSYLDFSAVTVGLEIGISHGAEGDGFTAEAGTGHLLSIEGFIFIQQQVDEDVDYSSFKIAEVKTGTGNDEVVATALPHYLLSIVDNGGNDIYDFDLDADDLDESDSVDVDVSIVDNVGAGDEIQLDVDSTGYDIYLHPQAVLVNNFHLTFNTGVEQLHLTDNADDDTTVTTAPTGPTLLRIKTGVTITQAEGHDIDLRARGDFLMEADSLVETDGAVDVYADDGVVPANGATITILGTIDATPVTVHGTGAGDTVTIGVVATGSVMTVNAGDGDDTINVGTPAPSIVDGISGSLIVNGEAGTDTLNVDDTGDGSGDTGTLTPTTVTGLGMTGTVTYNSFATLNVGLGTGGDAFTITDTHVGTTTVNGNNGDDVFNIKAISGPTTANGGDGDETFNVGSNAAGTVASPSNNTGGNLHGIGDDSGDSLTINGNDPTSGSDWLYVDDSGDDTNNTGTLTSTAVSGLGLGVDITYGTIEHLVISLGSGDDIFTITARTARPAEDDSEHGRRDRHRPYQRCGRRADRQRPGGRRHDQRKRHRHRQHLDV